MSQINILIADDSQALQTFMRQFFESHGFLAADIHCVKDGHTAATLIPNLKPDLLITDWFRHKEPDGFELHALCRKYDAHSGFGVTGRDHDGTLVKRAEDAGALFGLPKPFTADALRAVLAQALEKMEQEHPKFMQIKAAKAHAIHVAEAAAKMRVVVGAMPQYKPGDRVRLDEKIGTIKYVILRKGELVVQLAEYPGMVPAARLHRA